MWIVSILDRPEGRPLPYDLVGKPRRLSFNPRSPRRTTATPGKAGRIYASTMFQSSIAPKDDRYLIYSCITNKLLKHCFNPRSPRRTTATRELIDTPWQHQGSFNPRSPRRTTATRDLMTLESIHLFQSSIAPKDDRYMAFNEPMGLYLLFQSSIAPKDDRYL